MKDDENKGLSMEGTRRSWSLVRWSSNLQNLRFELESARGQIESLREADELDERGRATLRRCRECLADAERAFGKCFPRELFVWQMLFLIQQRLLLIVPEDELVAKWHFLQKRLDQKAKGTNNCSWNKNFLDGITKRLRIQEQSSGERNHDLRNEMMLVRKSLDDLVVRDLWQSIQIRRYTLAFMVLGVVLTVALLAVVMFSPTLDMHDGTGGNGWTHSAIGTVLAGALGAVLSALAPGKQFVATGVPLLTVVSAIRPVIGAAAGLFLYLLVEAKLLSMEDAELQVFAVGFGFSERAFFYLLGRAAANSDLVIGARFA